MSEEIRGPHRVDDTVLVHHLIRRLGRRPTPAEIVQAQQEWESKSAPAAPSVPPAPRRRSSGAAHP